MEEAHQRSIYSVSWSKVSGSIASCGADNAIRITKLVDLGEGFYKFDTVAVIDNAHSGFDINCVRWCPLDSHRSLLASCGDDDNVKLWSIKD